MKTLSFEVDNNFVAAVNAMKIVCNLSTDYDVLHKALSVLVVLQSNLPKDDTLTFTSAKGEVIKIVLK